ncbi:MAG: PAS domain S-box protein [Bacteroidetes bacterium]|nr:PAS domain S-box protein [Bacteroidota bacterium]
MKKIIDSLPLRVSLLYALVAGIWIVVSDNLISNLGVSPLLQTYKGWFFVFVTALLLYFILKKLISRLIIQNNELKVIEKELQEKSSMLNYILDNVPQSIFWKDINSTYLGCNEVFSKFAGLNSPDEIIGKTDFDLPWPKGEADNYVKDDKEVIGNNTIKRNIEEPLQTAEGKRLIINTTKIPLHDSNDNVIGVLGVFDDITDRKHKEEALIESEIRYRMLFESNPHPMWVYDTETFNILAVNDAAIDKYGYTKEEFLKLTIKDIRPEDDINQLIDFVAVRDEKKIDSGIWKHILKNGKTIHVEIYSHKIDFENKKARLVLANDVTERIAAEEALKNSELRHRSTLENMDEGYQIIGFDWRYIYVNDSVCRQAKKSRKELIGYTMPEAFPGIEKTKMFSMLKNCMKQRTSAIIENEFKYYDGSSGWFQLSIQPVPEGIFILSLDITERKEAENQILKLNAELERRVKERTKQLEDINKELEAFTYSVSHDLRSPLRAIDGFSKILLEDYSQLFDEEGKRLLSVIRNNTSQMDLLITDLLSLSRVAKTHFKMSVVNMKEMAISVFEEILSHKQKDRFKINITELPEICGDDSLLRQVWYNLISNAVKYSSPKENSEIEVSYITQKDYITYYIKDNGVGFNPDYTHKLFGVFQRLHSASEFEGTGVGLAIVERIINRHKGKVWGEGKLNGGAVFYFSLPIEENCNERQQSN